MMRVASPKVSAALKEEASADHHPSKELIAQTPGEIRYESLPTALGIMNVAVALSDLQEMAPAFAHRPLAELNRDKRGALLAHSQQGAVNVGSVPEEDDGVTYVSIYDLTFSFSSLVRLYDALLPTQNVLVRDILAFFDLLDEGGRGMIKASDLRHALCRLGDTPLSDSEYNHLFYRHRLLHKASLSVFEFVRLVMDIPVENVL